MPMGLYTRDRHEQPRETISILPKSSMIVWYSGRLGYYQASLCPDSPSYIVITWQEIRNNLDAIGQRRNWIYEILGRG